MYIVYGKQTVLLSFIFISEIVKKNICVRNTQYINYLLYKLHTNIIHITYIYVQHNIYKIINRTHRLEYVIFGTDRCR